MKPEGPRETRQPGIVEAHAQVHCSGLSTDAARASGTLQCAVPLCLRVLSSQHGCGSYTRPAEVFGGEGTRRSRILHACGGSGACLCWCVNDETLSAQRWFWEATVLSGLVRPRTSEPEPAPNVDNHPSPPTSANRPTIRIDIAREAPTREDLGEERRRGLLVGLTCLRPSAKVRVTTRGAFVPRPKQANPPAHPHTTPSHPAQGGPAIEPN